MAEPAARGRPIGPERPTAREQARAEPHVIEPRHRPRAALVCAAAMLAVLAFGFLALPGADAPLPAIARYAMEIALPQWKITEPVNEIVYGTRGFDTFGETFLLMAAIVSVATLARSREARGEYLGEEEAALQEQRESDPTGPDQGSAAGGMSQRGAAGRMSQRGDEPDEESEAREAEEEEAEEEEAGEDETDGDGASGDAADRDVVPGHRPGSEDRTTKGRPRHAVERFASDRSPLGSRAPEHSQAMTVVIRVAARAAALILGVTAVYVCARGYSPGGGFPAGAALSGVALLLYAALGYPAVSRVVRPTVLEPIEMVGALVVVALAVLGLVLRGSVMANWIPLAPVQTIFSGGLLQAFSVTELVEVATGLTIAVFAVLSMKHDWTPDEPGPEASSDAPSGSGAPRKSSAQLDRGSA